MEKINIADLLSNCPTGMELNCTLFDNVTLVRVENSKKQFPIKIAVGGTRFEYLTKDGRFHDIPEAKCIIFPKGKNTWAGFNRPFMDGDVIYNKDINAVAIFYKQINTSTISHCFLNVLGNIIFYHYHSKDLSNWTFATEKEKAKLFQAIKDKGYEWNSKDKTLEKLSLKKSPNFKVGDRIKISYKEGFQYDIKELTDAHYILENVENKFKYTLPIIEDKNWELISSIKPIFKVGDKIKRIKTGNIYEIIKIISNYYITRYIGSDIMISFNDEDEYELINEPKFKVGDRIKYIYFDRKVAKVVKIHDKRYELDNGKFIEFQDENAYEISYDKFDINTLKPFETVLVRNSNKGRWVGQFYLSYNFKEEYPFECTYNCWKYCIPYKGNEHLLNKTDEPDKFYITWKE